MDLQPQKPTREFRFSLSFLYNNGEEEQVQLSAVQDDAMEALLVQLAQFLTPAYPVSRISVDVGDRRERWVPKNDTQPLGVNRIEDLQ